MSVCATISWTALVLITPFVACYQTRETFAAHVERLQPCQHYKYFVALSENAHPTFVSLVNWSKGGDEWWGFVLTPWLWSVAVAIIAGVLTVWIGS
jgi:hypothetical protein